MTLAIKFCFMIYAAKIMSAQDFTAFGLYLVMVGYGILIIGFEFHTYFNREIATCSASDKIKLIERVYSFYIYVYIFIVIIGFFVSIISNYSLYKVFPIVLLLIAEHVSQEMSRMLIVNSMQNKATFLIFIRGASWCLLAAPLLYIEPQYSLFIILMLWLAGSILSVFVGVYYMKELHIKPRLVKLDLSWIKFGFKVSALMFLVSVTTQFFFVFDRLLINMGPDPALSAAYVLYITSALSIISLIDSAVVDFYKRPLFLSLEDGDSKKFKNILDSFKQEVIKVSIALCVFLIIGMHVVIQLLDRVEYSENIIILYVAVIAIYFFMLSTTPNMILYLLKKESFIFMTHFVGGLAFVVFGYMGTIYMSQLVVPVALLIVMMAMYLFKNFIANKILTQKFESE